MIPPFVGCVWFDFRILAEGEESWMARYIDPELTSECLKPSSVNERERGLS